jgi:aspartyl-tRNA(Asn)/glutamyl-tRNA(Gln) amidotransferase subunit A
MSELNWLGLADSARLIRAKEVSAVEILEATLTWISRTDRMTHAFVALDADNALEAARAADQALRTGDDLGALHGLTFTVKDVIAVEGLPMRCGSEARRDFVPREDAFAVARVRQAGGVFLGKVATSEFSWGAACPPALNPWDGTSVPGGSSGGSGAALAAGQCAASIGADCGCSVRMPAALNGVSGLRPSYGRVSTKGAVPLSMSMDTIGPMARSAEDVALLLTVMAGHDASDPTSAQRPSEDFTALLNVDVAGMRLGVPSDHFFDHLEHDVRIAVEQAISTLETCGMDIREVHLPHAGESRTVFNAMVLPEAAALLDNFADARAAELGVDVGTLIELGNLLLAKDYCRASQLRRLIRADFDAVFEQVDVMITPATAATARVSSPGCAFSPIEYEDGFSEDRDGAYCRFSMPVSIAGCPGLVVPCGSARSGLPIGMQIVAPAYADARALQVGHAFQRVSDWHRRRPEFLLAAADSSIKTLSQVPKPKEQQA